ncbi:MAG: hypothetical protein ACLFUB_05140 [Cyclobacteriaceae bacterium]
MNKLGIFLALMMCFSIFAQAADIGTDIKKKDWHQGKLVLQNGDTYKGKIRYDLDQNVAMVRIDGTIKAFSAHVVDYFRFMDQELKTLRRFYTMPYENKRGMERLMFFELVFQDGFALFNRESTVRKKQAMLAELPFIDRSDREDEVTVFSYFIFMPDGDFKPIEAEQQDLINKLALDKEQTKEMRAYIHEHELNLKNRSDFIRVIYKFIDADSKT